MGNNGKQQIKQILRILFILAGPVHNTSCHGFGRNQICAEDQDLENANGSGIFSGKWSKK